MKTRSSGAALITVLVIVFIVMTIIANLTVTNFRMIKRLENRQIAEQATTIAYSAIDFGRAALATSGATSAVDTLRDIWAHPLPQTEILPITYMSGSVVDELSKFNINDLVKNGQINPNVLLQFTLLLSYINISQSLAYNIAYYMAAPALQSDIMQQYIMGKPPYRPAGRPLVDLSELILVKGMNHQILHKIIQYITAVPVNGSGLTNESMIQAMDPNRQRDPNQDKNMGMGMAVNTNTASAEVIAAKSGISLAIAQRIVSARSTKAFNTSQEIKDFLSQNGVDANSTTFPGSPKIKVNLSGLEVSSNYFTIHAVVDAQEDQFRWVAYVFRQNRSGQWPQILWQHPE